MVEIGEGIDKLFEKAGSSGMLRLLRRLILWAKGKTVRVLRTGIGKDIITCTQATRLMIVAIPFLSPILPDSWTIHVESARALSPEKQDQE